MRTLTLTSSILSLWHKTDISYWHGIKQNVKTRTINLSWPASRQALWTWSIWSEIPRAARIYSVIHQATWYPIAVPLWWPFKTTGYPDLLFPTISSWIAAHSSLPPISRNSLESSQSSTKLLWPITLTVIALWSAGAGPSRHPASAEATTTWPSSCQWSIRASELGCIWLQFEPPSAHHGDKILLPKQGCGKARWG